MRANSKLVGAMACALLAAPSVAFADDVPQHSTLTNWRVFGHGQTSYTSAGSTTAAFTVKEGGAITITDEQTCVEAGSGQKCLFVEQGVYSLADTVKPSTFGSSDPALPEKIKAELKSDFGLDAAKDKSALPKQDYYVLPGTTTISTSANYTAIFKVAPVNDCVTEGPEVAIAWAIARIDQPYHEPFKILMIYPVVINDGTCKNKYPHLYRENIKKYTLEPIYRLNPSRAMCRLPALEEIRSECLTTRRAAGRRLDGLLKTRERCRSSASRRCRRTRSILRAIGYSVRPRRIVSPGVPGLTSVATQQPESPAGPTTEPPTEAPPPSEGPGPPPPSDAPPPSEGPAPQPPTEGPAPPPPIGP